MPVSTLTLSELAERMRKIDFAMLLTRTGSGEIAGRPMSNNGDVEYAGDSFFFTYERSRTVSDIERDARVALSFDGNDSVLGKPGIFIAVQGEAELIRERAAFEKHWVADLEHWFEQGIDTPGMVLIKVHATRIHYWDGEHEGEITDP